MSSLARGSEPRASMRSATVRLRVTRPPPSTRQGPVGCWPLPRSCRCKRASAHEPPRHDTLEPRQVDRPEAAPQIEGGLGHSHPPARLGMAARPRHVDTGNHSKLRGCDLVALRVDDMVLSGQVRPRVTVLQRKTGRPVQFEIIERTRESVMRWITRSDRKPGDRLSPSRVGKNRPLTTRHYARLMAGWGGSIGLAPARYGTHSLHRTKVAPRLSPHRQSAGGATPARPHEDREHGALPRCRGG